MSTKRRNLRFIGEEEYTWKYERSPSGLARCVLAKEEKTGLCVGAGAIFPRIFYVNGSPKRAWIAGDFSVDASKRAFGPAIKLQKEILSIVRRNGDAWIYGVPNAASLPIFGRVGYRTLGRHPKYLKVLRSSYVSRKKNINMGMFSKLIDLGLKYFSRDAYYRGLRDVNIEIASTFDSRFDELWDKTKISYRIIGERNSKFLNWRYTESPVRKYHNLSLNKGSSTLGYMVFFIEDNSCHVVDILSVRESVILETMFAEFIHYAKEQSLEAINVHYFGSPFISNSLRKFHFYVRDQEAGEVKIYPMEHGDATNGLAKSENWHFFDSDLD
jgi:hypothetical protein